MRKIHESDISLTPTQERLLGYIAAQTTISGAAQATKKELSQLMGCSVKTIDRAKSTGHCGAGASSLAFPCDAGKRMGR